MNVAVFAESPSESRAPDFVETYLRKLLAILYAILAASLDGAGELADPGAEMSQAIEILRQHSALDDRLPVAFRLTNQPAPF